MLCEFSFTAADTSPVSALLLLLQLSCSQTQKGKTLASFKKGILKKKKNRVYRDAKAVESPPHAATRSLAVAASLNVYATRVYSLSVATSILPRPLRLPLPYPRRAIVKLNVCVFQNEQPRIVSNGLSPWVSPQYSQKRKRN